MHRYILLFISLLFAGCITDPQYCKYPDLFQPGYHDEQDYWAQRFDPFTSTEMGPKIVGDRPSGALDATPSSQRNSRQSTSQ